MGERFADDYTHRHLATVRSEDKGVRRCCSPLLQHRDAKRDLTCVGLSCGR